MLSPIACSTFATAFVPCVSLSVNKPSATCSSDEFYICGALATLDMVNLVSFEYTPGYRATHNGIGDRRYLNVIAQEFSKVFPDWVKPSGEKLPDGSGILQVDTFPLTIYSVAAVKELHAKVQSLEATIKAQEALLAVKGACLRALESAIRLAADSPRHPSTCLHHSTFSCSTVGRRAVRCSHDHSLSDFIVVSDLWSALCLRVGGSRTHRDAGRHVHRFGAGL